MTLYARVFRCTTGTMPTFESIPLSAGSVEFSACWHFLTERVNEKQHGINFTVLKTDPRQLAIRSPYNFALLLGFMPAKGWKLSEDGYEFVYVFSIGTENDASYPTELVEEVLRDVLRQHGAEVADKLQKELADAQV
jgi:hypothetical protein